MSRTIIPLEPAEFDSRVVEALIRTKHPDVIVASATVVDAENIGNTLDKNLGTEIDLAFGFKMAESVTLKAGYSQIFATTTMEALKGGSKDEPNNWAWAMLVFKPKLIK